MHSKLRSLHVRSVSLQPAISDSRLFTRSEHDRWVLALHLCSAVLHALEPVQDFNESVSDIGSREVMEMMLITQYFDMLRDVGANGKNSTVFVPHQPGGITDIGNQIRSGMMQAQAGQI